MNKITNFSFWENQTYFSNIDLLVIGSGIVGLNAALTFKLKYPKAKVVVMERGILPSGASTKNAGFACFGSVSELLADIEKTDLSTVLETVEMRIKGLELLRHRLGDHHMDYHQWGGYELFNNTNQFNACIEATSFLNKELKPFTKSKHTYTVFDKSNNNFGFKGLKGLILNDKEGQINTGKMMQSLMALCQQKGIIQLNGIDVKQFIDTKINGVILQTSVGELTCKQLIVATNAFANELLKIADVTPARAQVLVTKPIVGLNVKGTFHYDEGYYYFRNIGNRILLGGGRHVDFKTETTTEYALNQKIHTQLDKLLKNMILPQVNYEIEQRWCGWMAVGNEKKPIIKKISPNVVCAVRMGGMGVAIGSLVGKLAIKELIKH